MADNEQQNELPENSGEEATGTGDKEAPDAQNSEEKTTQNENEAVNEDNASADAQAGGTETREQGPAEEPANTENIEG